MRRECQRNTLKVRVVIMFILKWQIFLLVAYFFNFFFDYDCDKIIWPTFLYSCRLVVRKSSEFSFTGSCLPRLKILKRPNNNERWDKLCHRKAQFFLVWGFCLPLGCCLISLSANYLIVNFVPSLTFVKTKNHSNVLELLAYHSVRFSTSFFMLYTKRQF